MDIYVLCEMNDGSNKNISSSTINPNDSGVRKSQSFASANVALFYTILAYHEPHVSLAPCKACHRSLATLETEAEVCH